MLSVEVANRVDAKRKSCGLGWLDWGHGLMGTPKAGQLRVQFFESFQ